MAENEVVEGEIVEEGSKKRSLLKLIVLLAIGVLLIAGLVFAVLRSPKSAPKAPATAPTATPTSMPAATPTLAPTDTPVATAAKPTESPTVAPTTTLTTTAMTVTTAITPTLAPKAAASAPTEAPVKATPVPTVVAKAPQEAAFTLEGAICDEFGCTLPEGWSGQIPAGTTCSGDITINGTNFFDNDATTGLIVYFEKHARVLAPWGAHCRKGDYREVKKTQLLAAGCGLANGCAEVHTIVWSK